LPFDFSVGLYAQKIGFYAQLASTVLKMLPERSIPDDNKSSIGNALSNVRHRVDQIEATLLFD
jgi:hypothetical protein